MARDKERSINPAQQQRKLEKAKALKKSKAELQTKRNEKLARRNPDRIQRQIDDLKALETSGDIKAREKAILADLERDLKAVKKARDVLGDKAPALSSRPQHPPQLSTLGKRRHDGQRKFDNPRDTSGSDTGESVRNVPWPRDTPPPVPKEFRPSQNHSSVQFGRRSYDAPTQPAPSKTTYESAPQIRDLKKEAVSRFIPNVVKKKQQAVRGTTGQLLEPEELDRLEQEGYLRPDATADNPDMAPAEHNTPRFSDYNPKRLDDLQRLRAEEEAFEKELAIQDGESSITSAKVYVSDPENNARSLPSRHVEIEEVEDEDL